MDAWRRRHAYGTFHGCASLKNVIIPASVKEIGEGAFEACGNLTSVLMASGIETIGSYAFAECFGLKSVKIPDSVTKIGEYAFYSCGFALVTIPDTVKSIGPCAFGYYGEYDEYLDIVVDKKLEGFKINCYAITAGHNYAKDNGFAFQLLIPRIKVYKGDVNGDEKIDGTDYLLIKRHILKIAFLSDSFTRAADTDGNGNIDSTDYIAIKRHILGISKLA